jgi:hypothetical protein
MRIATGEVTLSSKSRLLRGPVIVVKALQASPTELIEYVLRLRDVILV